MDSTRQDDGTDDLRPDALRTRRKNRKESQCAFWNRFGVTQSRGSRFEMGAEIPPPVAILLKLYLSGVVTDGDLRETMLQCRQARMMEE